MSAEDKLRDLLQERAETVVPRGDGLARIQQRVERPSPRRWFAVAAGAAAVAAVAVALVLPGLGDDHQVVDNPASPSTAPTPAPTTGPTTAPTPPQTATPTPTTQPSLIAYVGPAIWPFRSQAEGDAWRSSPGAKEWASDPVQVTKHFLSDYARIEGVTTSVPASFGEPPPGRFAVQLTASGRSVGIAQLARYGDLGPWTVVSVGATDLTITTPATNARVTSPLRVTGRVTGVDENVRLDLIAFSGLVLATTGAPAGSEVPWEGTLQWTQRGWTSAAVLGTTRSPKDGAITRIVALPVLPG